MKLLTNGLIEYQAKTAQTFKTLFIEFGKKHHIDVMTGEFYVGAYDNDDYFNNLCSTSNDDDCGYQDYAYYIGRTQERSVTYERVQEINFNNQKGVDDILSLFQLNSYLDNEEYVITSSDPTVAKIDGKKITFLKEAKKIYVFIGLGLYLFHFIINLIEKSNCFLAKMSKQGENLFNRQYIAASSHKFAISSTKSFYP